MTSHDAVDACDARSARARWDTRGRSTHGDRAPGPGGGPCDPAAAVPRRPPEDVRGVGPSRRRDDHAGRRRRGDRGAAGDGDRGRHPRGDGALLGDRCSAARVLGREGRRPQAVRSGPQGRGAGGARPVRSAWTRSTLAWYRARTSASWSRARAGRTCGCSWPTSASMLGCGAHLTPAPPHRDRHVRRGGRGRPRGPGGPLPMDRAVAHLPRLDLDEDEAIAAGHGRILGPAGIAGPTRCTRPTERSSASTGRRPEGAPAGGPRPRGPEMRPASPVRLGSRSHGARGSGAPKSNVVAVRRRLAVSLADRRRDLRRTRSRSSRTTPRCGRR